MNHIAWSPEHYADGRRAYPPELAHVIRDELGLDGTGRLLDVGCGPGSLTTLLAPLFAAAVGVDADAAMIAFARAQSPQTEWLRLRAEELPAGLGPFRVLTFAQSFHWMDQPLVARKGFELLEPGGAWVHVGGNTHRGDESALWDGIDRLIDRYIGSAHRANTRSGEEDVMRAAGWKGPVRRLVPQGTIERTADEVVSAVFSLSYATPGLFGSDVRRFEADLRQLLASHGPIVERMRPVEVVIWRP